MYQRALAWIGHQEPWLFLGTCVAFIGLTWLNVGRAAVVLAVVFFLIAEVGRRKHTRNLCERCFDAVPFHDPGAAVEKRRRELWAFHWGHVFVLGYGGLAIAAIAAWTWLSVIVGGALTAVVLIVAVYLTFTIITHRRLQPWCPYCDHGPGDEDPEIDPDQPPPSLAEKPYKQPVVA